MVQETSVAVHWSRLLGEAATSGTQTSSVKAVIIPASIVAARRGKTEKRTPSPAAMWPAPARYAHQARSGSHDGTKPTV